MNEMPFIWMKLPLGECKQLDFYMKVSIKTKIDPWLEVNESITFKHWNHKDHECMITHELNGLKQMDESRVNGLQCTMKHNGIMKNKGPKDQESMHLWIMHKGPRIKWTRNGQMECTCMYTWIRHWIIWNPKDVDMWVKSMVSMIT